MATGRKSNGGMIFSVYITYNGMGCKSNQIRRNIYRYDCGGSVSINFQTIIQSSI